MVINKDGLISEEVKQNEITEDIIDNSNSNLDLDDSSDEIVSMTSEQLHQLEQSVQLDKLNPLEQSTQPEHPNQLGQPTQLEQLYPLEQSVQLEQSEQQELPEEQPEQKETVETNCLALTVRKNYNLSIVKNGFFTTLRVSWKVAISTFILNIIKLFF